MFNSVTVCPLQISQWLIEIIHMVVWKGVSYGECDSMLVECNNVTHDVTHGHVTPTRTTFRQIIKIIMSLISYIYTCIHFYALLCAKSQRSNRCVFRRPLNASSDGAVRRLSLSSFHSIGAMALNALSPTDFCTLGHSLTKLSMKSEGFWLGCVLRQGTLNTCTLQICQFYLPE